jgi:hypothetical protein
MEIRKDKVFELVAVSAQGVETIGGSVQGEHVFHFTETPA